MTTINYRRQILSLTDPELEQFTREWVAQKKSTYVQIIRFSGPRDMGRDVVGFYSQEQHEGHWDNYQCKQYGQTLSLADALLEIGKIIYYAHLGNFSAPTNYYLVVPRGLKRNLRSFINRPAAFKEELIREWEKYCGDKIHTNKTVALDVALREAIMAFNFANIIHVDIDYLVCDQDIAPVLFKWFGADPGPAPYGQTPIEIHDSELPYINKLVKAYNEKEGTAFNDIKEVMQHSEYGKHLALQRERYYDADAFKRFYRDNTNQETLEIFEKDMYHGVIDTCMSVHTNQLACIQAVMAQAANVQVSGPLAPHARVPIKQGICHHLANEDRIKWHR
jgi:hypothetical protein